MSRKFQLQLSQLQRIRIDEPAIRLITDRDLHSCSATSVSTTLSPVVSHIYTTSARFRVPSLSDLFGLTSSPTESLTSLDCPNHLSQSLPASE